MVKSRILNKKRHVALFIPYMVADAGQKKVPCRTSGQDKDNLTAFLVQNTNGLSGEILSGEINVCTLYICSLHTPSVPKYKARRENGASPKI